MNRKVTLFCLLMAAVVLVACGKKSIVEKGTETAKPDDTTETVTGGAASGEAVKEVSYDDAFSAAESAVKEMTLEAKVAQMFLVDLNVLQEKDSGDKIYKCSKKMKAILEKYPVGGIFLSEKNVKDQEQSRKLTRDLQEAVSGPAMFIAVEEEGGGEHSISLKVNALKQAGYSMAGDMGALPAQQIESKNASVATELKDFGFNFNLAPVADYTTVASTDYARRCFGSEVDTVEDAVTAFVKGMNSVGVISTLKYFPGAGSSTGEYGKDILINNESLMTLRKKNFAVYSAGIKAGADCVMVGNISVPKITASDTLPAFLAEDIVTSLLREELNFEGIILTSSLKDACLVRNYTQEYAAVEAVKAGCDMILQPLDFEACYQAVIRAVNAGEIDEKVINTAVRRILITKIQKGICVLEDK